MPKTPSAAAVRSAITLAINLISAVTAKTRKDMYAASHPHCHRQCNPTWIKRLYFYGVYGKTPNVTYCRSCRIRDLSNLVANNAIPSFA